MKTLCMMLMRAGITGMIFFDTAREHWQWGAGAALLMWLAGVGVSLVPLVRTLAIFGVLLSGAAWWQALLLTMAVQSVLWMLDVWAMGSDRRAAGVR